MKKVYDLRISIIRFLAMNMIIICHIMQYNQNLMAWWLNVGVQIFLFMSGYLYSKKNIKNSLNFYLKNFLKIFVPYYITIIPIIFIYLFIFKQTFSSVYLFKIFLTIDYLPGGEHLWFIQYILFCYLITPLYKKLDYKIKNNYVKLIIVLIFLLIVQKFKISAWIFCYLLGLNMGSKEIRPLYLYLICLCMNLIQIYIDYFSKIELYGSIVHIYEIFCNYAHVFLGISIFYILMKLLNKKSHIIESKRMALLIKYSDKYSYNIFLVHQFIILGPMSLMTITTINTINIIMIYVLIVLLGVVNYYISNIFLKKINRGEKKYD